jgi:predicted ATPase/class 3 adenylate cyclase
MDPAGTGSVLTFLFTDIEGSTRLWEQDSERMRTALARHNALARAAVEGHNGTVVKLTGDGVYAAFADGLDALSATLELQQSLTDPTATDGLPLPIRCGLHAGVATAAGDDLVGSPVNRAARIMSAAHGGQILLSQVVVDLVRERLPAEVSLRDLGSVWLRDIATPERVYQAVHPRLASTFPALRSLEATPNNLPRQATLFIGREHEITEIRRLLDEVRLLTLVGIGGLGKTRLSQEVAARVLDDYIDGAWFVDLAPVTDARLVPQVVAFVLGVKEEAGRPVVEALERFVQDRRLLLILDNCEHVGHACATLASQLLRSGEHLKVMATSREPLHVTGETTYPVPPLALPDPSRTIALSALSQYEAIRFFRDRAAAALPSFELTDDNAAAVADICRRLDGLPLALELAAARVRALPIAKIAERLQDRFRLLTGGDKTRLPRQQTLAALIDWSYDLLTGRERAILQRLSVFAGGFTLEAAESVAAGDGVDEADVLDTLIQLVEKSLVVLERDHYRQLETVRQYAQGRLAQAGGESDVRTRHLSYYVALAEKARPELVGPAQGAWLTRFDFERENFLAAHAWCDHAADGADLGLRLVHAIRLYWLNRGLLALGHRVTVDALARPGAQVRTLVRSRAAYIAGQLSFFIGRYDEALAYLGESAAISRELGDKDGIARALTLLGVACLGHDDLATAREHLEEALALSRELGEKVRLAGTLNAVAELRRTEGKLDAAEQLYEESLSIRRELGDRDAIAIDLLNLTVISIGRGLAERARDTLYEAFAIATELDSKKLGQAVLDACAGLCAFERQATRAARFYGASAAQMERMGLQREPAVDAFLTPLIAQARDDAGETEFVVALDGGRALAYEDAMAEARAWLAR